MAHSFLSDYHYSCVDTNPTHVDIETTQTRPTPTQLRSLPRPSFGSFLKATHKTSLSDGLPSFVGVSAKCRETKQTLKYLHMNLWKRWKCNLDAIFPSGFWLFYTKLGSNPLHLISFLPVWSSTRVYYIWVYLWLPASQMGLQIRSSEKRLAIAYRCCCADCWTKCCKTSQLQFQSHQSLQFNVFFFFCC